ncbi:MAG: hypothetical protein ACE5KQ_05670 [Thermoplasmata archaeon]
MRSLIRHFLLERHMGQEGNIQVFNEWITAHRAHDLDRLVSLLADDIKIQLCGEFYASGERERGGPRALGYHLRNFSRHEDGGGGSHAGGGS